MKKFFRTKSNVIIDGRNGKLGIAAVKFNKFMYLDGIIQIWVKYLHQVPTVNPMPGMPKFEYEPIPTVGGNYGEMVFTFDEPTINALFSLLDISIMPSDIFCTNFKEVLVQALFLQTVNDEIFRKVDENNVMSILTANDYEFVESDEIFTE